MRRKLLAKRRTRDRMVFRDFTCSAIHRRPLGHWPFFVSFDGLRQGFRSVFGSTAVYRCIYSNEQKQSHASDLSDSANQGMAVGAKDGLYQCSRLETRTLLCPCLYPLHIQCTYECPPACPQILEEVHAHFLSQRRLCMNFSTCLSFGLSFSPLSAHLPFPMLVCAMHATAASPAPSPTAPAYSTWASTRVSPRSPPSAPSSRDGVARGGSSCRIGRRRLLH